MWLGLYVLGVCGMSRSASEEIEHADDAACYAAKRVIAAQKLCNKEDSIALKKKHFRISITYLSALFILSKALKISVKILFF